MEREQPRREFNVTYEEALTSDSLMAEYYDERLEAIKAGEEVWLVRVRSFRFSDDPDQGNTYDYWIGRGWWGHVSGNARDGFFVFRAATDEEKETDGPMPKLLNVTEPKETLGQAMRALEDYVP